MGRHKRSVGKSMDSDKKITTNLRSFWGKYVRLSAKMVHSKQWTFIAEYYFRSNPHLRASDSRGSLKWDIRCKNIPVERFQKWLLWKMNCNPEENAPDLRITKQDLKDHAWKIRVHPRIILQKNLVAREKYFVKRRKRYDFFHTEHRCCANLHLRVFLPESITATCSSKDLAASSKPRC